MFYINIYLQNTRVENKCRFFHFTLISSIVTDSSMYFLFSVIDYHDLLKDLIH